MAAKNAAAPSLTTAPAALGAPAPPHCPGVSPPERGHHTLHIEYAVWSKSFQLVHTRPDGTRDIHRRGIPNLRDAKIKAQMAAGLTGWTLHD